MEFKKYTVEELVKLNMLEKPMDGNHGGKHPTSKDYVENGIPFIMVSDINNGKIDYKSCKFISKTTRNGLDKGFSKPNDILLSHKATIGLTAIVGEEFEEIVLTPQLTYYRVKNNINNKYLKYYFDSKYFQNILNNWATSGSTRAYLGITAQLKLPILLPDIIVQNKIAKILSDIDRKIELNNKINDNLYKYMENLYKEWFVKYSIYKDSNYKDSELGLIPEGCEIVDIYSISNIIYGAPFKSSLFNDEKKGMPIIRIRDLKSQEFKTYTEEIHPKGYLLKYGDIAVGMDGEFKPYIWGNDEAWLNQRICVFDNKRKKGKAFLYYSLKPLLEYVESTETATTVIHIGKNDFDKFRIVLPSDNILNRFDELTNPMIEQIVNNIKENNFLTKLRDILLPKLMNGEIDLDKIEI